MTGVVLLASKGPVSTTFTMVVRLSNEDPTRLARIHNEKWLRMGVSLSMVLNLPWSKLALASQVFDLHSTGFRFKRLR